MVEDVKKYFNECKLSGSFILYDVKKNIYNVYNMEHAMKRNMPASTFKICNSLIALETGVIKDENAEFSWDSTERSIPSWNRNHNLASAFKNSVVWYYQELARRIGTIKMQEYINKAKYGNLSIEGGIDSFWLDGDLRISPFEQIDFLNRFYFYNIPFQKINIDIVKNIMIAEKTELYTMSAKTGWAIRDDYTGWYVGYIEKNDEVYFFSTCVEGKGKSDSDFIKCRIEITKNILKYFGIIE
jgi:beta-lactamase class D